MKGAARRKPALFNPSHACYRSKSCRTSRQVGGQTVERIDIVRGRRLAQPAIHQFDHALTIAWFHEHIRWLDRTVTEPVVVDTRDHVEKTREQLLPVAMTAAALPPVSDNRPAPNIVADDIGPAFNSHPNGNRTDDLII